MKIVSSCTLIRCVEESGNSRNYADVHVKDGFEQETIESVQKSEHQDDCLKIFIAEVESSVTTAASVYAEQSERRTRVGLAMIRENSLPTYITEREEMKPEVDGAKRFIFLEVMISDYRTSPLHIGAGAALIEAIKRFGRENEKDTLYVDCWAGNDAKLNRSGFSTNRIPGPGSQSGAITKVTDKTVHS